MNSIKPISYEKVAERSMYVKRCKEEEERQLLRPKHLSSDELEAVGERLYEVRLPFRLNSSTQGLTRTWKSCS